MQRFIAFSLAVHGLAIAGWYNQHILPEAGNGARTIALALQVNASAVPDDSRQHAPPGSGTAEALHTGQQTAPPKPAGKQAQHVPPPAATSRQPPDGDGSHSTSDTAGATARAPAAASRALAESAQVMDPAMDLAADDIPARQALQTAVYTAIRANFRYPRIARRNGWEGTVVLALRVLPDGKLTDILVSSSSGHPVLDRAAVHTLQTASVPQAGEWLKGQACELVIPVEYHLLDS